MRFGVSLCLCEKQKTASRGTHLDFGDGIERRVGRRRLDVALGLDDLAAQQLVEVRGQVAPQQRLGLLRNVRQPRSSSSTPCPLDPLLFSSSPPHSFTDSLIGYLIDHRT